MSLSSSLNPKYTATSSNNLSLGTFGVTISGLPSPMSDCASDELIPSISNYISSISCDPFNHSEEPNLYDKIIMEHSYSRAWNWRPDVSAVKPARELMIHKPPLCPGCHDKTDDVIVDVVEPPSPQPPVPYDLDKGRALMSDIDKYLDTYTTNNDDTDWEENINQDNWSLGEQTYYKRVTSIIHDDYLARTTLQDHHNEPLMRRVILDGSVSRFRQAFNSVGWDIKLLQWLHNLLLDNLNKQLLSVYLDILQGLKIKLPTLIDKIMFNGVIRNGPISNESLFPLLKKPWDPIGQAAIFNKMKRLPNNPIILVCPSFPQPSSFPTRHQRLMTLLGGLARVETVQVHIGPSGPRSSMTQILEHMLASTRAKLQEIRTEHANQPIVLFGMHSGAALAFQIAQTEVVACIVCIGFNIHTVEGKRGTPDDILLDMMYPTLFVVGQNSDRTHPEEMENLREKMKADTSLIVVGSADDSLRIPKRKKLLEGITQSMVDRCVMDEIGDYITNILTNPFPIKKQLPVSNKLDHQLTVTKIKNSNKNSAIKRRISDASESGDLKLIPMKKPRPGVQQTHAAAPGTVKISTISSSSVGRPRGSIKNRGLSTITPLQTALQTINNPPPGGVTVKIGALRSPHQSPIKQRTVSETEMMPPPPLKAISSSKSYSQKNSKINFHKNITAVEQLKSNLDNSDALDKAILSILPGEETAEESASFVTTVPRQPVQLKQHTIISRTSNQNNMQHQKNNTSTSTLSALLQSPDENNLKRFTKVGDNYTTINRPVVTSNKILTSGKGQIDLSKLTLVPHGSIKNNQTGTASSPMMLPLPSARLPNAKFVKISNRSVGKHVIIRPHAPNHVSVAPIIRQFEPAPTINAVEDITPRVPTDIENTNILDIPIVFADNDGNFNEDLNEGAQLLPQSSQNTAINVTVNSTTTQSIKPQPKMVLINRPNNVIKTSTVNIANLKNYTPPKYTKVVLKRPADGTVKINNVASFMKPSTSTVSSLPFMENYDLEADIVANKVLKSNPLVIRQHLPETSQVIVSSSDSTKSTSYPIVFNVDADKKFKTVVTTQDKHKNYFKSPIILKPGTQMRPVNKTITVTRSLPTIVSRKQVATVVSTKPSTNDLVHLQTMQNFNFEEIDPDDQDSEMN